MHLVTTLKHHLQRAGKGFQAASVQLLQAWFALTRLTKRSSKLYVAMKCFQPPQVYIRLGDILLMLLQNSSSSASLSGATGQSSGGTDYLKSALEASANQKETFFARKMEVRLKPCHIQLLIH